MTQPTNLKMTDSMVGRCAVFFCTTLLRMCTRMSEIGILTGHTSLQAPQRLEAYGSDLSTFDATPRSCGVRMAPIGPG